VEDKEEYKKLVYVAADKISFLAASRKGEWIKWMNY
jgi:hypothetical protein